VDDDQVLPRHLKTRMRRLTHVEVDVGLVADDEEPVLLRKPRQLLVVGPRGSRSRWIVRIAVEPQARPPPIVRGNGVEIGKEASLGAQRICARRRAGEEDGALVDGIGRIRIPAERPVRARRAQRKMEQRLLRARAREDLAVRIEREREATLQVRGDGLAQGRDPGDRRVLRNIGRASRNALRMNSGVGSRGSPMPKSYTGFPERSASSRCALAFSCKYPASRPRRGFTRRAPGCEARRRLPPRSR